MTTFDYILLALFVLGVLFGVSSGAIKRIFGIAGVLLGVVLGIRSVGIFAPMFAGNNIPYPIAVAIVIIAAVIVSSIIFRLLGKLLKASGPFITAGDKVFGGILGGLQFALMASICLNILSFFHYPSYETIFRSIFYQPVLSVMPWTYNAAITVFPEARTYGDEVKKMTKLDSLEERMKLKKR